MGLLTRLPKAVTTPGSVGAQAPIPAPGASGELRIALVCDGGVSLAIYEHGITRELENVVIASRAVEMIAALPVDKQDAAINELTRVQQAYVRLLQGNEASGAKRPKTVVIDVIAGTSAGGINGVFLAKALSTNTSVKPLTTMWMERGDVIQLSRRSLAGIGRAIRTKIDPGKAKVSPWAPFNGARMSTWLAEALTGMDESRAFARAGTSLLSAGHDLDLFVTTTDLRGYDRMIPSKGGSGDYDRQNRMVFHFSSAVNDGQFGPHNNGGLAFAARSTSSFPGAFPPSRLDDFAGAVKERRSRISEFTRAHMDEYILTGHSPEAVSFSDGGLLDNSPFDLMISAITAKSAQTEVDRRIVHLNPDPKAWETPPYPTSPLSYIGGILKALHVRASQSLVGDLLQIQAMTDELNRVDSLTTALAPNADDYLKTFTPDSNSSIWAQAQEWALDFHDTYPTESEREAWSTTAYDRLKVNAIAVMMASDLAAVLSYPSDSQQAECIRVLVDQWAGNVPGWQGDTLWKVVDPDPPVPRALLKEADLPYQERRLRFMISRLNKKYGSYADAAKIDAIKGALWRVLRRLLEARQRAAVEALTGRDVLSGRLTGDPAAHPADDPAGDPAKYGENNSADVADLIRAYRQALGQYDGVAELIRELDRGTYDRALMEDVVRDFLWFPIWDAAIYPVVALTNLPQLSHIALDVFSPQRARMLNDPNDPNDSKKLQGTRFFNFGGFFRREWRENDYLWGRLDAVELILRQVGVTDNAAVAGVLQEVLDECAPDLTQVKDLIDGLQVRVAALR